MSDHGIESPKRLARFFRGDVVVVGVIIIAIGVFFEIQNHQFGTHANLLALLSTLVELGLATIGETLVIIGGEFDLSVGGTIGIVGIIYAKFTSSGVSPIEALLLCVIGAGIIVGISNGLLVTKLRINSFIATLGTGAILAALADVISGGIPISLKNSSVLLVGSTVWEIPVYVWVMAGLFIIVGLLAKWSIIGRQVYVVGGNQAAARVAGLRVGRVKIGTFAVSAMTAALAGVIVASQLVAAAPTTGTNTTLLCITAAVIGGASLMGGEGGFSGAFLGALLLAAVTDGLALNAVPSFWRGVVTGSLLLVTVGLSQARKAGVFSVWRRWKPIGQTNNEVAHGGKLGKVETKAGPPSEVYS